MPTPTPTEVLEYLDQKQTEALQAAETFSYLTELVRKDIQAQQMLDRLRASTANVNTDPTPQEVLDIVRARHMARTAAPDCVRITTDHQGTPGSALVAFVRTYYPRLASNAVKPTLERMGYLRRTMIKNRPVYRITEKGETFFFEKPYATCPSFPEMFITPSGEQEFARLYRENVFPYRTYYQHD